jgi:hypothetical protein
LIVSDAPLVKIRAATAGEVCAHFDLKPEAQPLLHPGMPPRQFIDALLANKQYLAGIEFLAHALPVREGIWWGCLCLQHACGENLTPADRAACIAVVQWVTQPSEQTRAAVKAPADVAGPASPAGVLGIAAFQTGGSIAPPKAPPMPPPPFAWSKSLVNAIKLAVLKGDPIKMADTQRAYMELGIGLAEGRF